MSAAVSTNACPNASLLTYHDVWIAPAWRGRRGAGTVVGDSPRRARSGRDLDSGRWLTRLAINRTHRDDSCFAGPSCV